MAYRDFFKSAKKSKLEAIFDRFVDVLTLLFDLLIEIVDVDCVVGPHVHFEGVILTG